MKPRSAAKPVQERPGRIEYLYLTSEQLEAVEDMNDGIDNLPPLTRLRCQIPMTKTVGGKTVVHYPHTDYDERTPPQQNTADLMCKTSGRMCPLAEQCLKLGKVLEAPVGVWGGRVLVDGKEVHNKGGNE